jgi:DnaJ-domain-containing protein 1
MSITRRIIDLARSNLNSLLERAADTTDPRRKLSDVTDAELEAELQRRRAARTTEARIDDAKQRVHPDRAERERQARERADRVRADREARARAAGAARPGAAGPRASQARGAGPGSGPAPGGGARPGGAAVRNPELKRYYERLEVEVGADFEAVRAAYRKLMRKYHPDLHANKTPEKQRAANEVSAALTQAYNELEKALKGGPNKG